MEPSEGDHDRALAEFAAAAEQTRAAFAGTAEALRMLERTWDRGLRDCLHRLDDLQQGVEEALRLTRLLVDRMPKPA